MNEQIRFKTCLVCGLVVCVIAYFLPELAFGLKSGDVLPKYLPVLVVFPVLLAGLGYALLKRWLPGAGVMWARVLFASLLVGLSSFVTSAFVAALLPSLYYYETPENDMALMFPAVPRHLVPFSPEREPLDRQRMELFYRGLPKSEHGVPWYNRSLPDEPLGPESAELGAVLDEPFVESSFLCKHLPMALTGRTAVWQSWVRPFFWWLLFFGLVYAAQFCLAGILRRQWLENEQLMFPHAVALAEGVAPPRKGLFRSQYFWFGAMICALIYALEGLHHYFPAFPRIELFGSPLHWLSLGQVFSQHPWSAMSTDLSVHPYIICIAFLLPKEISFSVWVFALLDNLLRVVTAYARLPSYWDKALHAYGLNAGSDQAGAILVLVGFLLWVSRRHLWDVFKRAFYDTAGVDKDEYIPYRVCLLGFIAATLGILAWCMHAGMDPLVSLFLFGAFYLLLIFTSRLVSELGLPEANFGYYNQPHLIFIKLFGYNNETMLPTFAVNTFIWAPLVATGPHLCPRVLTAFKLTASATGGRRRFAAYLFVLSLLVAGIFFWGTVKFAYVHGALNTERESMFSSTTWIFGNTFLRDIVFKDRAHAPDRTEITAMFIGAGVMSFLLTMRSLFYWWPLHPLGYVATSIDGIWFSFLIAWLAKRTVLKYGGGNSLPKANEFFVGLFAGEFAMAGFWLVVGIIAGDASFRFM